MPLGKGLSSLIPSGKKRLDVSSTSVDGQKLWYIPISEIVPNSEQPRKNFKSEALQELADSIKLHGVLQPLTVSERSDGGYELIAGERRLRASQMAGLATVPAIVRSTNEQEKLELALIENIQRQDLNPLEEAFAYKRLVEKFGLQHNEIAARVGKSRPVISNTIRLLDLPEKIQRAVVDGVFSLSRAKAILSLKNEMEQIEMFEKLSKEKVSSAEVEKMVEDRGQVSRKGVVRRDPNLSTQEQLIAERFHTKVRIRKKGQHGTILIEFFSDEEYKRLIEDLT